MSIASLIPNRRTKLLCASGFSRPTGVPYPIDYQPCMMLEFLRHLSEI
jgi:hypothetical protein